MSDGSDDSDQQVIFAMFLGAVAGAVFGYVFYQDVWQGIIVGIGVGTFIVMVFPATFEELHKKPGDTFGS